MVDSEPNVIDDVKASAYAAIFNPSFLLTGYEDAANNFARGHYTIGKEMIDKINDRLRKLVENCNNLNGFFINHAVGGGDDFCLIFPFFNIIFVSPRYWIRVRSFNFGENCC